MSDYRKQFVIRQDGKGRWRWSLYESGMKPVAEGRIAARSYEACVADALKVADLAATADIWDAERQALKVGPTSRLRRASERGGSLRADFRRPFRRPMRRR